MFDFGFWELVTILVIALIVVGPERLPRLAQTAGFWIGKARRFVADIRAEIHEQVAADELKKALEEQDAMEEVYEILEETRQIGHELKTQYDRDEPGAGPDEADDKSQDDVAEGRR